MNVFRKAGTVLFIVIVMALIGGLYLFSERKVSQSAAQQELATTAPDKVPGSTIPEKEAPDLESSISMLEPGTLFAAPAFEWAEGPDGPCITVQGARIRVLDGQQGVYVVEYLGNQHNEKNFCSFKAKLWMAQRTVDGATFIQ